MSAMFNPPHPGAIVKESMESLELSINGFAKALKVSPSTVQRLVNGKSSVSPEMALRLEAVIGSTASMWLRLQSSYDLWNERKNVDVSTLQSLRQ